MPTRGLDGVRVSAATGWQAETSRGVLHCRSCTFCDNLTGGRVRAASPPSASLAFARPTARGWLKQYRRDSSK